MTVYVVQEVPKFNISGGLNFGDIEVVLPPGNMTFDTEATCKKARKKLANFTDDDYLMLIGDPIALSICFNIAVNKTSEEIKLLKWDRQTNQYLVVKVNTNTL